MKALEPMKYFIQTCIALLLLNTHAGFSQVHPRTKEVYATADSIVSGPFSGVILIDGPNGEPRAFVGGTANKETGTVMDANHYFNIFSLGKSLTAALIVRLAQEGKLELDDTISKFLPERNIPNQDSITIRQMLGHSSGLGDYMTSKEVQQLPESEVDIERLLSVIEKQAVEHKPGKGLAYSNSAYIVLGGIVEVIEGREYREVLESKLLAPAGIEKVYFSSEEAGGNLLYYKQESQKPLNKSFPVTSSDGGTFMQAADLLSFIQFLYSDYFTDKSRELLFNAITPLPRRDERKNPAIAASFLTYEYPNKVKVIGNNGGFKGSTYAAFRILTNENGKRYVVVVLSNQNEMAGYASGILEEKVKDTI